LKDRALQFERVSMRAEDLVLEELVQFSEGLLSLHGRRLILHDIHAFAQLRGELVKTVGEDSARRLLTRFGHFWGQNDASAMKRIFKWENMREWLLAGPRLHALQGVTRSTVKSLSVDEVSGHFEMTIDWHNSGEAEEHLYEFGPSKHPVGWIMTGYLSGYASFCVEGPIYFIEGDCRAKGDERCRVVGKDKDSWGDELEQHLPFFQAEDIKGRIEELSRDISLKNLQLARQREEIDTLEHPPEDRFLEMRSQAFQEVLNVARSVARFDTSVLIAGETGTGKEVLARYIHSLSPRGEQPFVAVNCGALPETLLESELFGHKAGSFTGAVADRIGLFEQANLGTVFLDEVSEMSPAMQVKLLRVLQNREVQPVGDSRVREVDVRIIAATNRDLDNAVEEGSFRDDLLYRLCVVKIQIPPLRERRKDILPLARHFVKTVSARLDIPKLRLAGECIECILGYLWPGNVRELENAIEHAAVFSREGIIYPECLPPQVSQARASYVNSPDQLRKPLAEIEQEHIRAVLDSLDGNRTRTAEVLGINTTTLWRKLKKEALG
jgi:two-component system, NtrC family, response regulator HydG